MLFFQFDIPRKRWLNEKECHVKEMKLFQLTDSSISRRRGSELVIPHRSDDDRSWRASCPGADEKKDGKTVKIRFM